VTRILFAIPGDIESRTGGYEYSRRVLAALENASHLPLPGAFPHPAEADVVAVREAISHALRPGDILLIDGLAYGALPVSTFDAVAAPIVALCHHPLCLETGLPPERGGALRESEAAALRRADRIIVTSAHTGETLTEIFGVAPEKIAIALPGVDPTPRALGSGGAPALLAVGSLIPRKGFDILIDALSALTHLDWRLDIVGSPRHAPETAAALRARIDANAMSNRIFLRGEATDNERAAHYARGDVFVSSSHYEGYGMALAEALAAGLAIVTTTGGAAAQTAPDGCALKIPPGDIAALRVALSRVLTEPDLRSDLSDAAWRAGQCLPRWADTARIILSVAETFT